MLTQKPRENRIQGLVVLKNREGIKTLHRLKKLSGVSVEMISALIYLRKLVLNLCKDVGKSASVAPEVDLKECTLH